MRHHAASASPAIIDSSEEWRTVLVSGLSLANVSDTCILPQGILVVDSWLYAVGLLVAWD